MGARMKQWLLGAAIGFFGFVGLVFADAKPSSYALVGKGRIGRYSWVSWLERPEGRRPARDATCISIATREPASGGSESGETYECVHVRPEVPIYQAVSNDAAGRRRRTVVVMLFDPSARRVDLELRQRGRMAQRSITLRRVSERKARQVGIEPIAYWSHGFAGSVCIGRMVVYGPGDSELSDSGPEPCRAP